MTDQEWQEGIERALNAAWGYGPWNDDLIPSTIKSIADTLVHALPLRITLVNTNKDQLGHFRVGPARDEEA